MYYYYVNGRTGLQALHIEYFLHFRNGKNPVFYLPPVPQRLQGGTKHSYATP